MELLTGLYLDQDFNDEPLIMDCGNCQNIKCRCSDCFALSETENGEWFCDEAEKRCCEVIYCDEWEISPDSYCNEWQWK